MSTELATRNGQENAALMERVVIQGDLAKLTPTDRVGYYRAVCESVGLNPFTKPFDYITLNGKLTLYAKRDATDQLRKLHGVSITALERDRHDDLYVVTAHARDVTGREDESTGAVSIANLKGEALANAIMKAETKAKRRVTLSICGLGLLDETEVSTVPDARTVHIDQETGEILDAPKHQPRVKTDDEAAYRDMTVATATHDAWRWFAAKSGMDHAAVCQRLGVKALKGDLPDATLGTLLDRLKAPAAPAEAPALSDAEVEATWGDVPPEGDVIDAEATTITGSEPGEEAAAPESAAGRATATLAKPEGRSEGAMSGEPTSAAASSPATATWRDVPYKDRQAKEHFQAYSTFQKAMAACNGVVPKNAGELTLGEIVRLASGGGEE